MIALLKKEGPGDGPYKEARDLSFCFAASIFLGKGLHVVIADRASPLVSIQVSSTRAMISCFFTLNLIFWFSWHRFSSPSLSSVKLFWRRPFFQQVQL